MGAVEGVGAVEGAGAVDGVGAVDAVGALVLGSPEPPPHAVRLNNPAIIETAAISRSEQSKRARIIYSTSYG
ncbi:MAG: hypothetical protein ACRETC_08340 [Gammaproteobacteria bacterium]